MKENDTGAWAMLILALGALGNWTMFQKAGEKFLTRWVDGLPRRRIGRRLSDERITELLAHERAEVDTLTMMMLGEYDAGRVTLVEYDCPETGPTLATCIVEQREPKFPSVKHTLQRAPLEPAVWAEVQRVHSLPSQSWYVADVRRLENYSLRSQLTRSGVRSAYYQAMPALEGHCGAMMSISWGEPTSLSDEELAGLHWSGRTLAAVLRAIWLHLETAA